MGFEPGESEFHGQTLVETKVLSSMGYLNMTSHGRTSSISIWDSVYDFVTLVASFLISQILGKQL